MKKNGEGREEAEEFDGKGKEMGAKKPRGHAEPLKISWTRIQAISVRRVNSRKCWQCRRKSRICEVYPQERLKEDILKVV